MHFLKHFQTLLFINLAAKESHEKINTQSADFPAYFLFGKIQNKARGRRREPQRKRESERDARIMAIESAQTNNKVRKQRAERMAKTETKSERARESAVWESAQW